MMKKTFIISLAALVIVSCQSSDKKNGNEKINAPTQQTHGETDKPAAEPTTLEWMDPTTKDLGKLNKDQSVEITYRFRNTGDKNLVIEHVSAQCGCTIPEKPEEPIPPGGEGLIKARYNGSGSGTVSKEIYVKANTTPKDHTLTFKAEIQDK